jgi:CheY-like chemotaxis protein
MHDPSAPSGRPVVLVAEDEELICRRVHVSLEAAGFFVLTANDGEQALELSRGCPGAIQVLVSDIVMPRLNGLARCVQTLRERPAIHVLRMFGQTDQRLPDAASLLKPFRLDDLKTRVRQLLGPPPEIRDTRHCTSRDDREPDALWAQLERYLARPRRCRRGFRYQPLGRRIIDQKRIFVVRLVGEDAAARLFPCQFLVEQLHPQVRAARKPARADASLKLKTRSGWRRVVAAGRYRRTSCIEAVCQALGYIHQAGPRKLPHQGMNEQQICSRKLEASVRRLKSGNRRVRAIAAFGNGNYQGCPQRNSHVRWDGADRASRKSGKSGVRQVSAGR